MLGGFPILGNPPYRHLMLKINLERPLFMVICLIPSNYFPALTGYHAASMLPTFGKSSSVGVSIAENLPIHSKTAWLGYQLIVIFHSLNDKNHFSPLLNCRYKLLKNILKMFRSEATRCTSFQMSSCSAILVAIDG